MNNHERRPAGEIVLYSSSTNNTTTTTTTTTMFIPLLPSHQLPTRSNKLNCSKGNSININFLLLLIVVRSVVVVVFVHAKSRLPIRNNDCGNSSRTKHTTNQRTSMSYYIRTHAVRYAEVFVAPVKGL